MWIRHTEQYSHFIMFILKYCNRSKAVVWWCKCVTILIHIEKNAHCSAHTRVDNVDMSLNFHSKWTGKELFTELTREDFAPARHQCVAAVCGWVVCPHIKCLLWKYECHFSGGTLMAKPFMTLVLGRAGGGQAPLPAQTFYDICKHNKNKITLHQR